MCARGGIICVFRLRVCMCVCGSSVLNQTLINPVGALFLYSDISMITMHFVLGGLARDLHCG